MRHKGYCPTCGSEAEHLYENKTKSYLCLLCGVKEDKSLIEDVWDTLELVKNWENEQSKGN